MNFALRCPFFIQREQVIRLIQARGKITKSEAETQKKVGGVSACNFKNFAVVDGKVLSLKHVGNFEQDFPQDAANAMMDFVNSKMLGPFSQYNELIVVCRGRYTSPFSHACTFLRYTMSDGTSLLKMLDSKNIEELYFPRSHPMLPGRQLSIKEDFANLYLTYDVYAISRKPCRKERAELINTRMVFVMTGKHPEMKQTLIMNADDTHKKRRK